FLRETRSPPVHHRGFPPAGSGRRVRLRALVEAAPLRDFRTGLDSSWIAASNIDVVHRGISHGTLRERDCDFARDDGLESGITSERNRALPRALSKVGSRSAAAYHGPRGCTDSSTSIARCVSPRAMSAAANACPSRALTVPWLRTICHRSVSLSRARVVSREIRSMIAEPLSPRKPLPSRVAVSASAQA